MSIHLRTTLTLDDALVGKARDLTGVQATTRLVDEGLRVLIASAGARRLAALGGSERALRSVPRRRLPARRTKVSR